MTNAPRAGASDYLAAERTFLAWIRTGLALIGFGFVVARFGLFVQALQIGRAAAPAKPYGPSFWLGTALMVLGIIVNAACAWNYFSLVRRLDLGEPVNRPSWLALGVAGMLVLAGLMAIYLITIR